MVSDRWRTLGILLDASSNSLTSETAMTRMIICALVATLAGAGVSTRGLADDTNSARPVKTQKQMMKECMAKVRSANTGASEDDMKKTCREKIQSYNNHPSETKQPPDNP
jgi:hypothetical protein